MSRFIESDHNRAMRQYEQKIAEANASNQSAQSERRKSIEDELVEEGLDSIKKYEKLLSERWEQATCLAQYDGINNGYSIARRARNRISATANSSN